MVPKTFGAIMLFLYSKKLCQKTEKPDEEQMSLISRIDINPGSKSCFCCCLEIQFFTAHYYANR